jgi:trk system potassium uptake protein TrkA
VRIIVVGAGQVGSNIAANLAERHDIILIDLDPEKVEELTYSANVLAIEGDGTSTESLIEAGIEDTEMVIACTDADETNLVTCGTVKTLGEAFTIARVRGTKYLETWD